MILSFGVMVDALALVLGVLWCRAMFRRWRKDLDEIRNATDVRDFVVIAALWGITCVVACVVIGTSIGIVRGISAAV